MLYTIQFRECFADIYLNACVYVYILKYVENGLTLVYETKSLFQRLLKGLQKSQYLGQCFSNFRVSWPSFRDNQRQWSLTYQ